MERSLKLKLQIRSQILQIRDIQVEHDDIVPPLYKVLEPPKLIRGKFFRNFGTRCAIKF